MRNLQAAGLRATAENLSRWGDLPAEKIIDAIDRGFPAARDYIALADLLADYSEATRWPPRQLRLIVAGFSEAAADEIDVTFSLAPETAARWLEAGFSEQILLAWLRSGDWWSASATNTREVLEWASLGFSPEQRSKWLSSQLTLAEAQRFTPKPFTIARALSWVSRGWQLAEAEEWLENGFKKPADALDWREAGLTAIAAKDLRDLGFQTHREVAEWTEAGFTAGRAGTWLAAGVSRADEARSWLKHFTTDESMAWLRTGITLQVALRRQSAGIKPPTASS